jgi:hypothetical protein
MIKFFRKIRQNLLLEGKNVKYLKYAIGEIVLVVIGILIALGINNWNQENKDLKLSKEYLSRIHRDIVQDTINFREIINYNKNLRSDIKGMLVTLYGEIDKEEQVQKMSTIYDNALNQVFSPNNNTYNGMVNSGGLQLIKSLELKEAIVKLYSEYDEKKALFLSNKEWMDRIAANVDTQTDFIKFSDEVIDIYTLDEMLNQDDWSFLNNKNDEKFKFIVRAISATAWNQKVSDDYYYELIGKCKIVLQLLEKEL